MTRPRSSRSIAFCKMGRAPLMVFLWVVALMAPRASSDGEALPQADGALKVLMVSIGFHGHVIPLVRLAEALVGRGHDVTLATHDSVEARQWARDAGARPASGRRHCII